MPKTVALSMLSIVVPSSYTNDWRCGHPRLKGGLFLMLNYLTNMIVLGVSLSYTIVNHVPNVLKGVVLPNPNVNIKVRVSSDFIIFIDGGRTTQVSTLASRISQYRGHSQFQNG